MATNFALASNGSTATASTEAHAVNFPASSLINGIRHTNNQWGSGGGWSSQVGQALPQWIEIAFGQTRSINRIDVFTLDDGADSTSDPTLLETFSSYGIVDFKVQYWNGSTWIDLADVTGNDKVWRQFTFSSVSTTKIRIYITSVLNGEARLLEVEAWGELSVSEAKGLSGLSGLSGMI
jgi:hypothetical protein